MEVVGPEFEVGEGQGLDSFGLDVDNAILILQRALDQNKFAA